MAYRFTGGGTLLIASSTYKDRDRTNLSAENPTKTGTERKTVCNMVSETITTELKKYGIGNKLRRLRLRKSMGLLELSKHTGLSPALLSKLERDVMHPTLPTLARIAMVFSVGLEHFFNSEPKPILEIVRKKDRLRFPDSPDAAQVGYYFESLDFPVANRVLNCYLAEFHAIAPEQSSVHEHSGMAIWLHQSSCPDLFPARLCEHRSSRRIRVRGYQRCVLVRYRTPAYKAGVITAAFTKASRPARLLTNPHERPNKS